MRTGLPALAAEREGRDHGRQRLGLLLEIARDLGTLVGQQRVLLRDLVHMRDRAGHLVNAVGLLGRGLRDLADRHRDLRGRIDDLAQRRPGILDQPDTGLNLLRRVCDQGLDAVGGFAAARRQCPHLGRHHREAAPGVAGARRLDRGVQRQEVGLEGDLVDHRDDLGDAGGGLLDAPHRIDRFGDDRAAACGDLARLVAELDRHARIAGAVLDGGGELLGGRRRLLQAGGVRLGALGELLAVRGDLQRRPVDPLRNVAD